MRLTQDRIELRRPDNWHNHFRDDFRLEMLIIFQLQQFARAIAMPNLPKRIRSGKDAMIYKSRIMEHAQRLGYPDFELVMTLYLTENTTPEMIRQAWEAGVRAAKVYPKGATTESDDGIVDYDNANFHACLDEMTLVGMLCLIHCEVPDESIDPQDREQLFMPILRKIHERHSTLKIVVEHITSRVAVETVLDLPETVAATVTCHHRFLTRDDLNDPHNCCMPRAKSSDDRDALREVVLSGNPKFFYGGDDAPHHRNTKEGVDDPSHGVWCGPTTMPLLIEFFSEFESMELLEPFVSEFGAQFYGLPLNEGTLILVRSRWKVLEHYHDVVPFRHGQELNWRVLTREDREAEAMAINLMMGPL